VPAGADRATSGLDWVYRAGSRDRPAAECRKCKTAGKNYNEPDRAGHAVGRRRLFPSPSLAAMRVRVLDDREAVDFGSVGFRRLVGDAGALTTGSPLLLSASCIRLSRRRERPAVGWRRDIRRRLSPDTSAPPACR